FPLTAISAFVAMRAFDISRPASLVCAALFAILPFHFQIGAARPFESGYWVIPIACYLILAVAEGRPLFARAEEPRHRLLAYAPRRTLWTVVLCALVASAGIVYFTLYAAILVVIAMALAALRARRITALVPGIVVTGLLAGALALNLLPTVVYELDHG